MHHGRSVRTTDRGTSREHVSHGGHRRQLRPRRVGDGVHVLPSRSSVASRRSPARREIARCRVHTRTDASVAEHSRERWSDGVPITARDLVYSWRRHLAPETGNSVAYLLYCVRGAEAFSAGKSSADRVGVSALDDFTFRIRLTAPAPYFLQLCSCFLTLPVPAHAIEAARKQGREASWIEPGNIVTSGPFVMVRSRPRDETVVVKNWNYFDADLVGLEGIRFAAADGAVVLNLFRAGQADSMDGRALPLRTPTNSREDNGSASASHGRLRPNRTSLLRTNRSPRSTFRSKRRS